MHWLNIGRGGVFSMKNRLPRRKSVNAELPAFFKKLPSRNLLTMKESLPIKIRDSVALVTGANRGLGLAFVEELLTAGSRKFYAAARSPERIANDPRVDRVHLDVTKPDTITRIAAAGDWAAPQKANTALNRYGSVDESPRWWRSSPVQKRLSSPAQT
jgi:hypothetical protein